MDRLELHPHYVDSVLGPRLTVDAIEVNQATQYFRYHSADQSWSTVPVNGIQQMQNSVPLVAGKPTIVRVYISYPDKTWAPQWLTGPVRGTLRLRQGQVVPSANGLWPGEGRWGHERTAANDAHDEADRVSLNFVLPWDWCNGNPEALITMSVANDPASWGVGRVRLAFQPVPHIPVKGVLVAVGDLPAPSPKDLVDTFTDVLPQLPSPGVIYGPCVTISTGPLMKRADWEWLHGMTSTARTIFGDPALWVVLLPEAVPTLPDVAGLGRNFVAMCAAGDSRALVHEIAHAFGLDHIQGSSGNPPPVFDPAYPTYGTYPRGSVGEYGIDWRTRKAKNPKTTSDIMSYAKNLGGDWMWVSPYSYTRMMDVISTTWTGGGGAIDFVSPMPRIKSLAMAFAIDGEEASVVSAWTFDAAVEAARPSHDALVVELVSESGEVLAAGGLERAIICDQTGEDDEAPRIVTGVAAWHEDAASVAVRLGPFVLGRFPIAANAPDLGSVDVTRTDRAIGRVAWTCEPSDDVVFALRYSHDGGQTWTAVIPETTAMAHAVALDALPGGAECCFEVMAASGFRTATARSESFERQVTARAATILWPPDGAGWARDEHVVLVGGGYSPDFGSTLDDEVVWWSNRDGILGSGTQLVAPSMSIGRHRLTLRVLDGLGGEAEAVVHVTVSEPTAD